MARETYFFIFYIQTFLSALIAIASFYRFSERDTLLKLIGGLFVFSCVCNTIAYLSLLLHIEGMANIPGSVYGIVKVIVVGIIFNYVTKSKHRDTVLTITIVYCAFAFFNLFFLQKVANASYNKLAGSFIIMVYTIWYFYKLMVELPAIHLHRLPMFWFNSAFLIFHAATIFLFAFTTYLINEHLGTFKNYWAFHNLLVILEQLIILAGVFYDIRGLKKITTR